MWNNITFTRSFITNDIHCIKHNNKYEQKRNILEFIQENKEMHDNSLKVCPLVLLTLLFYSKFLLLMLPTCTTINCFFFQPRDKILMTISL